jgi:dihydroxyacetone kinase-like protein
LDAACVRRWLDHVAAGVRAERDHLTQLDAAIGDADHGVNMHRGFNVAMAKVAVLDGATPGQLVTVVGRTLIATVGGAAGPLYGTAFLQAGEALGAGRTFGPERLLEALQAALDGVQRIGAAAEGDKTMVDALAPAVAAFDAELRSAGGSLESAVGRLRTAATEGMRATIPMQARKGRASYLGPRSVGHQDPGATSTALILGALGPAALGDDTATGTATTSGRARPDPATATAAGTDPATGTGTGTGTATVRMARSQPR